MPVSSISVTNDGGSIRIVAGQDVYRPYKYTVSVRTIADDVEIRWDNVHYVLAHYSDFSAPTGASAVEVADAIAAFLDTGTGGGIGGSGTLNYIPKFTPNGNTLGNSLFYDNGSAIGLGTINPLARLHVVNNNVSDDYYAIKVEQGTTNLLSINNRGDIAIGRGASAGSDGIAIGNSSSVVGYSSIALGNSSSIVGSSSTALGFYSRIVGNISTALGFYNSVNGNNSTALGNYSTVVGNQSNALGFYTSATGDNSTALGSFSFATGNNSTVLGFYTSVTGNNLTALGTSLTITGNSSTSTSIGCNSYIRGNHSIVLGHYSNINNNYSIALGSFVETTASNQFVIGLEKSTTLKNVFIGSGVSKLVISEIGELIIQPTGIDGAVDTSSANSLFTIAGSRGTGTGTGGDIRFSVATAGASGNTQNPLIEAMRITQDRNVGINIVNPLARLHIKGSGDSSSTYALKVQNSVGTDFLTVRDDGWVSVGVKTYANVITCLPNGDLILGAGNGNTIQLGATNLVYVKSFQLDSGANIHGNNYSFIDFRQASRNLGYGCVFNTIDLQGNGLSAYDIPSIIFTSWGNDIDRVIPNSIYQETNGPYTNVFMVANGMIGSKNTPPGGHKNAFIGKDLLLISGCSTGNVDGGFISFSTSEAGIIDDPDPLAPPRQNFQIERMRITPTGNVGIGIIPTSANRLHIQAASGQIYPLKVSGAAGLNMVITAEAANGFNSNFELTEVSGDSWYLRRHGLTDNFLIMKGRGGGEVTHFTILPTGNVGIGADPPVASAILELQSTNKGFLPPRMTTEQRNNILSPADGLMVFDISLHQYFYYDSNTSVWVQM